jgi:hypothetical protein
MGTAGTFVLGIAATAHNNDDTVTAVFDNLGTMKPFLMPGSFPTNYLPATTPLSIESDGTLDLNGGTQQVASLSDVIAESRGSIINRSTAASVLTLCDSGGSTTFRGAILGGGTLCLDQPHRERHRHTSARREQQLHRWHVRDFGHAGNHQPRWFARWQQLDHRRERQFDLRRCCGNGNCNRHTRRRPRAIDPRTPRYNRDQHCRFRLATTEGQIIRRLRPMPATASNPSAAAARGT